jgi:very-long-chain enoyl-CoA reductase
MGYTTSIGLYVPDWTGLTITAFLIGILLSVSAIAEISGEATPYSKFGNRKVDKIPSRTAMVIMYLPSVFVCYFIQNPVLFHWNNQFDIVHLLNMTYFVKRVFEVCFVHIYKSTTNAETAISIMCVYTITTWLDLLVIRRMPESAFSNQLTKYGIICVAVGLLVNAYHHWLLRQMRLTKKAFNQKKGAYNLPQGGLFNFIIAPHYAAEQLIFLGFILVSQNIVSLALKMFPFIYLSVRAQKTHEWYSIHLTDKKDKADLLKRKYLIPYIW